jgi:hypothetical protein
MLPVSGTVAHGGAAVSAGRVIFSPLDGGKIAFGRIQSDGTFQLTTETTNDGAIAGQYRVMVSGDRDAAKKALRVTYIAPSDQPFEIRAGQENRFAIDIRMQEGWEAVQDD